MILHGCGHALIAIPALLAESDTITMPAALLVCGIGLIVLAITGLVAFIWKRRDKDIDKLDHNLERHREHVAQEYVRRVDFDAAVERMERSNAEVSRVLFAKLDGLGDSMSRISDAFARHEGAHDGERGAKKPGGN